MSRNVELPSRTLRSGAPARRRETKKQSVAVRPGSGQDSSQLYVVPERRAGSSAILNDAVLPSIRRRQHVSFSEQKAAARRPVGFDLAGSHPPVDGANLYAAQLRNFPLREKLFTRGAVAPHSSSPSLDLRKPSRAPGFRVAAAEIAPGEHSQRGPIIVVT